MASKLAVPFLVANMGCELLFVVDHRLRELPESSVPRKKKEEILDDVARAVFNDALMENIFAEQKLYSMDTFRKLLMAMVQSPSMRISPDNFEKMFKIMCMTMKCQVMRFQTATDIVTFSTRHLDNALKLLEHKRGSREAVEMIRFVRASCREFYGELTAGEYIRLRITLLDFFRELRTPVVNLIQEGFQAPNGLVLISTGGPNANFLGEASVYGPDNDDIVDVYSLAIAGRGLEEKALILGENFFSREAVAPSAAAAAVDAADGVDVADAADAVDATGAMGEAERTARTEASVPGGAVGPAGVATSSLPPLPPPLPSPLERVSRESLLSQLVTNAEKHASLPNIYSANNN